MIRKSNPSENPAPSHHSITDHPGIVDVVPRDSSRVEIAFDPARLSENDIRNIALEHIQPDASLQRFALRLDGQACEAAAAKLERRIENVPGVRRATATYIGRVLCLTFDKSVTSEASVLAGARAAGADVRPLESRRAAKPTLWQRAKSGDLNEEISCAAGLVFLIASFVVERAVAKHGLADWLYLGAYIFCGQYGVRSAIASLREKTLDVDVLMVLAALGAAAVGSPFEGALLLFLFSFSNVLQRHALERTQNAIESLLTLRPETALRKTGATTESVPVDSLQVGDVVIVRPGELIPIDGDVVEGSSNIDESSLTGESIPVPKSAGSPVFGGTLNQSGAIEIRVNHRSEDSTLARMVRLVAEAQAEKSNTQRFLEKAEQGYAAGVIAFTALVLLVPWLLWHEDFSASFYRAMTVMVVASPCALVISTPATVLSAIGGAARRGVLIKGGAHLETATRVDIVCLDKTGTLTVGKPTVTDIVTAGGSHFALTAPLPASGEQLLATCASLEAKSEHPLATAVVQAAQKASLTLSPALDFQSSPGRGADALIDGVRYVVGSERLFAECSASGMDALRAASLDLQSSGKSCIWLGRRLADDSLAVEAIFGLADTLRPEGREIVRKLHALGVRKVVMLTGDQQPVAAAIAKEAGIDEFHAALLPADKVAAIRQLKTEGTVMMVGDGVNDAPALATAHLGVAMGAAGTDIAMETADIVLMGDRLDNIPLLVGIARHSRRVLIQNLTFASGVILILLAASLGFALPLPLGVVGHEGSTVLVCLNGLRLLVYKGKN